MPGRREVARLPDRGAAALASLSHARMRSLFGVVLCASETITHFTAVGANVHLPPVIPSSALRRYRGNEARYRRHELLARGSYRRPPAK